VQFPKELFDAGNGDENGRALAAAQQVDPSIKSVESIIEAVRTNPQVADALRPILAPRHPSQIYEALLEGVVLFAVLWFVRTRFRAPNGFLTGLFLIVYSILRIIVENFREPDAPLVGMFTRGQFFSFFTVAIGIGFIVWSRRYPTYPRRMKNDE
jgi:phosphatidylglycerol---prolipoprotein diacylglyceryl transferase